MFLPIPDNHAVNGGGGNRTRDGFPTKPRSKAKYVYFIQAGGKRGPIKIGVAVDPRIRLHTLQVGNHLALHLIAVAQPDDAALLERRLHGNLWKHQLRCEWFKADPEVLAAMHEAVAA